MIDRALRRPTIARCAVPKPDRRAGATIAAQIGDRIIVASQKIGRAAREGGIREIIEASYGTRYRVRWDDGQESAIRPAAASARTTQPAERPQVVAPGPEAGPSRRRGAGRTRKGR